MSETSFPKVEIITGFKCCKCGATYPTEEQAEDCFDRHMTAKEIVREYPRYINADYCQRNYNNYPINLDILFSDGEVIRYSYSGKKDKEHENH
jgi:hypothetical protein